MSVQAPFLLPGDRVRVRSWPDIQAQLDARGTFEGLPFMPEMLKYCGLHCTVSKRLERTCEEGTGQMRRIRDTVFLDEIRCDGAAHGRCQKECRMFWKAAWLEKVFQEDATPLPSTAAGSEYPYSCTTDDGRYMCQSTELIRATSPLSATYIRSLVRDIRAKTYTPAQLTCIVMYALFLRLRRLLTGRSYRVLEGKQTRTPMGSLCLRPGETVRVKTEQEIAATLDAQGKNRGLAFTVEMRRFCGKTFRVLKRLETMIHEPSQKLIRLDDTVILDNVTCNGCYILRGGCPRDNYHFWREVWLERAAEQPIHVSLSAKRATATSAQMARIRMKRLMLSILVVITFTFLSTPCAAQFVCTIADPTHKVCSQLKKGGNAEQGKLSTEPFSGTHWVKLTWNPSISLQAPFAEKEGYNLYRWNKDEGCRSMCCVPVSEPSAGNSSWHGTLIKDTKYQDFAVESGELYRYSVTTVRGTEESGPTNMVEVVIPGP